MLFETMQWKINNKKEKKKHSIQVMRHEMGDTML